LARQDQIQLTEGVALRIFVFASESRPGLHAFAGDKTGSRVPAKVGPWRLLFGSATGARLPHGISRPTVETAIRTQGFQMWRLKA
jgi:hypothetical protein